MIIQPSVLIIPLMFGMCIGSFLNVCIYRIPLSRSIVYPPSACPKCGYGLKFYDNIPVISYLVLRGRCRQCGVHISIRYPFVELLTGMMAVCTVLKYGLTLQALVCFIFIAVLMVITYIDIDHQIIPDVISLPGIPIFFLASFAVPSVTWQDALIGIFIGGGSLFAVAWIYCAIKKIDGMGGGDIKLLAMIGAFIGWKGVLFTIFVSSAVGTIAGIIVMAQKGGGMKLKIPFGPFLSIGAVTYIFFGAELIKWYFNLMRP